ncbi:MAG: VTT domain-containing protein [Myxococcales bacterium]|nr:VTT domain-containing protein [Myxococcales bacterium]MCB9708995.1 VTT domain-containing protein [Myxococcales bacterium]
MAFLHWLIDIIRDPGQLIVWGGYPGLALIIFLETGALVFFLPGDSLLVMAGLYAAKGDLNLFGLNALLIPMAILGDATSYWIGTRTGMALFNKPRSRWFRPEHLNKAHAFYERHGGKAIILARFMPIVRTFVPIVAGIGQMTYRKFVSFNVIGAIAWVFSMTFLGYFLGARFPVVIEHIEKVIVIVIFVSILPGIIEALRVWLRERNTPVP